MDVVQQIAQRLEATGEFDRVGDSVALSDLSLKAIRGQSAAWVGELSSVAGQAARDIGPLVQMEKQVYGVVIGVRSINERDGLNAKRALQAKRLAVRTQLFDWAPAGYDRFVLAGGELLTFADGALFWVERFSTQRMISKENLL